MSLPEQQAQPRCIPGAASAGSRGIRGTAPTWRVPRQPFLWVLGCALGHAATVSAAETDPVADIERTPPHWQYTRDKTKEWCHPAARLAAGWARRGPRRTPDAPTGHTDHRTAATPLPANTDSTEEECQVSQTMWPRAPGTASRPPMPRFSTRPPPPRAATAQVSPPWASRVWP